MLKELDGYDWAEAFGYAGEPGTNGRANVERVVCAEDAAVPVDPFTREDVFSLVGLSEGENDERPWLVLGILKDGRWFYLDAGCDYTGWDCQASGTAVVAGDLKRLIRFGITPENRARLGVAERDTNAGN